MRIVLCLYPTIFSCVDPRSQRSRFFTGISRRRYVVLRKDRESERDRERKRERERERDRERESTLQVHVIYNKLRIALCLYPTIFSSVDPRSQRSRFFTEISRRRYEVLRRLCLSWGNVFPHRESTSWNFQPKSEFSSSCP